MLRTEFILSPFLPGSHTTVHCAHVPNGGLKSCQKLGLPDDFIGQRSNVENVQIIMRCTYGRGGAKIIVGGKGIRLNLVIDGTGIGRSISLYTKLFEIQEAL